MHFDTQFPKYTKRFRQAAGATQPEDDQAIIGGLSLRDGFVDEGEQVSLGGAFGDEHAIAEQPVVGVLQGEKCVQALVLVLYTLLQDLMGRGHDASFPGFWIFVYDAGAGRGFAVHHDGRMCGEYDLIAVVRKAVQRRAHLLDRLWMGGTVRAPR